MPTYYVHLSSVVTTVVEVEADSPEAAENAAYQKMDVSLCHQCAGRVEAGGEWGPYEWTSKEDPDAIELAED